jgi:hypothetical protein
MMFCYILKHNFFRGALGASWRPFWCLFGCPLASLWDVLGSLWPPLGTPWAHFGPLWSSWVSLGRPWGVLGPPFGCLWEHFVDLGGVLGCNFGHFGSFFDDMLLILWSFWYLWLDWCLVCGLVVLEGSGDSFLVIFFGVWLYVLCFFAFHLNLLCLIQSIIESVSLSLCQSVSQWVKQWVREWVRDWVSQWES